MAWESSPSSHDPALPEAAANLAALAFLREDRLVGEGVEGQVGHWDTWTLGHWDTGTPGH